MLEKHPLKLVRTLLRLETRSHLCYKDAPHRGDPEEGGTMAQRCEICGKGPTTGHRISHAHNLTKRRWLPNLQRVRALVDGRPKRLRVCTRCIRSGRVLKASRG